MSFINSDSRSGYTDTVDWFTGAAGTYYYVEQDTDAEDWLGLCNGEPDTGLTVVGLETYANLLGYPMVEVEVLEWGADSATDGGDTVAESLTAMGDYDQIQTPGHLQAVFQRWATRGIEITALSHMYLGNAPTDPAHALPRSAYLIIGDGATAVARTVQQWAVGEVFRVHRADRDDIERMRADDLDPEEDADQGPDYAGDTVCGVYFRHGYPTLTEIQGCF